MDKSKTLPLGEECVICFSRLRNKKIAVTECGHAYHHECILAWFNRDIKNRCPLCNTGKKIGGVYPVRPWWYCSCFYR
jgi:hypothetical protein